MVGPAMSFEIDIRRRIGDRDIALRCSTGPGLTALVGPSGAGKSSVLNMVAGLLRPDEGRITVAGRALFDSDRGIDLPPERRNAGYVFQDVRLFPHMKVRGNLFFGLPRARERGGQADFAETIAFMGINALLDRWPRTLSGGEAQRVAIARALLSGPDFLLMDEPLASVDPARREEIFSLIIGLRDTVRLPILYVSHDRDEVARLATSVVTIP